jgi:hypothetical protein
VLWLWCGCCCRIGVVTTVAGNGSVGYLDGNGIKAQLNTPGGIVMETSTTLLVSEWNGNRIRRVTLHGEHPYYSSKYERLMTIDCDNRRSNNSMWKW